MKKTLLQAIVAGFAVALSFSSCLGDNTSSFETGKSYAYVGSSSESLQKYALVREIAVPFTSPEIRNLSDNRIYILGFKLKLNQSGAIFTADNVNLVDEKPLSRAEAMYRTSKENMPELTPLIPHTKLRTIYFQPHQQDANDIWAFSFTSLGYKDDFVQNEFGDYTNISFHAILITDQQSISQEGGGSKPLEKDQAVVHFYMTRKNNVETTKNKETINGEVSIDMSDLRRYFATRVEHKSTDDYTLALIQFKYISDDKGKEESLGSLDMQQASFGMWIENPTKPK